MGAGTLSVPPKWGTFRVDANEPRARNPHIRPNIPATGIQYGGNTLEPPHCGRRASGFGEGGKKGKDPPVRARWKRPSSLWMDGSPK
ncbi:hypothetical protein RHS01_10302 [Rhizoctonia solani]|uniref:Uncharacterized protein n=1 Tax=Rhizoctonia solani TaxID=456999 RepID=A0A8H7M015_9AGAM|nr:hypothetical protein RHS01_10302 [Rhizoctonia solani]